jgi:hypothetical protein
LDTLRERWQAPAVLTGMEPTDYFWKLLAADIEQRRPDYGYRLVNPFTVKKNRAGDQLGRSKGDNRDAFTIGDLLRTGKYTETRLLHDGYAELRQYVTLCQSALQNLPRQVPRRPARERLLRPDPCERMATGVGCAPVCRQLYITHIFFCWRVQEMPSFRDVI